jgi:hypothetical protein
METNKPTTRFLSCGFWAATFLVLPLRAAVALDTARIDAITGLEGVWNETEKVQMAEDVKAALVKQEEIRAAQPQPAKMFLKARRSGSINIVAIHSQMTHENPRILFLRYWGRGATRALANTLRAALDRQSK